MALSLTDTRPSPFAALPRLPPRPLSLLGYVPAHRAPKSESHFDPDMAILLLSGRIATIDDTVAAKAYLRDKRACNALREAVCVRSLKRLRHSLAVHIIFTYISFNCKRWAYAICVAMGNVWRMGPVILLEDSGFAYKFESMMSCALRSDCPEEILSFNLTDAFQSLMLLYSSCVRAAFRVVVQDLLNGADAAKKRAAKKGSVRSRGRPGKTRVLVRRELCQMAAKSSDQMKGMAGALYTACKMVVDEDFAREVMAISGCSNIDDKARVVVSNLRYAEDPNAVATFLIRFCGLTSLMIRSTVDGHLTTFV